MPHLILECSSKVASAIEMEAVLRNLHEAVGKTSTVDARTLKSRVFVADKTFVGPLPGGGGFMHLTVLVLPGRDAAWKKSLGEELLGILRLSGEVFGGKASLTVEIKELNAEAYFSVPIAKET